MKAEVGLSEPVDGELFHFVVVVVIFVGHLEGRIPRGEVTMPMTRLMGKVLLDGYERSDEAGGGSGSGTSERDRSRGSSDGRESDECREFAW